MKYKKYKVDIIESEDLVKLIDKSRTPTAYQLMLHIFINFNTILGTRGRMFIIDIL